MFAVWISIFVVGVFIRGVSSDSECPLVSFENKSQKTSGFRLVQYNAEWLFVDYYSPMKCPGSGCTWANESEATIHMQYVGNVVSHLNPDIMNVCEVEGCDELNLLQLQIEGSEQQVYLKQGTDTATGQNVGLVTKWSPTANLTRTEEKIAYPLENSMCGYTGAPGTVGVSKHYITEYTFYERPTLFIGLHLLAYPEDTTRCVEREAQSQIIQNVIAKYKNERDMEVIVLGDFNDFDGRVVDSNRNVPTSRVLDILKGLDGAHKGEYELKSAAEKIPQVERFSDWWDKNTDCVSTADEFSLIDYVLVTPFLFDKIANAFVYHGYDEFCGKYDSDHYPLVVDFL